MDRHQLLTEIEKIVEQIGAAMRKEDDDWAPVLIFGNEDRVLGSQVLMFADDDDKQKMISLLPEVLRESQATLAAVVFSSWLSPLGVPGMRPSEHPERREIILIAAVDRRGTEYRIADIIRQPGMRPSLSTWQPLSSVTPDSQSLDIQSPWIAAIRAGLE